MHVPWLTGEYERTCKDCGHAWIAPKWAVHPPMRGLPVAGLGSVGGRYEVNAVVTANAELAEKAAAFRRCHECESAHYRQRRVWS